MPGNFIFRTAMLSIAVLFLAGCFFTKETFVPVKYYDIGNPDPSKFSKISLKAGAFTVTGPYKQEMVYRSEKNELIKEPYSRWAIAPDVMLRRYLKMAFADGKGKVEYTVTGNILAFEADLARKEAVLTVEYRITPSLPANSAYVEKTSTFRKKMDESEAEAFAGAMAGAVSDFAESIAADAIK
ncbi:MAG TPA: hypothetical protein DET40_02690 [Lentisphaeria bacterium]|nr:MAG: hypothetical protein A2X45_13880 [Lentisphaerae bacterium GWF2_50_93]HCE42438.1 hypothetical protein [Lentisphaeria bacterium]